ncbi:MAG: FtsQ-type POTRA domain-containing protein [Protaetiibacter sp.]
MKRPEGFDAPPTEPDAAAARAVKRPAPKRAASDAAAPIRATSRRPTADRSVPVRPAGERPTSKRPPRPSSVRVAQAELRAAERARKRAEKRELRRFTRRTRRRRIAWLTGSGIVVALVGMSIAAVYSPLLALREIRVEGASSLDPAQIVAAIDGQEGTPLALFDEQRLREELSAFTLIRSYSTEILPPGTLILHIVERTPIGLRVHGGSYDIVDPAGVVLGTVPQRPDGLPLIQLGDADADSAAGRSIAEVLLAMPDALRTQIDTIGATTRDNVTLTLVGSTQRVEWGSAADSEHKARVLTALLAIHGGSGAGSYDVSAPGTAVFHAD